MPSPTPEPSDADAIRDALRARLAGIGPVRRPRAAPSARPEAPGDDELSDDAIRRSIDERAAFVETIIQQAIRRGDFDDLPGAGKPLAGLERASQDPDWWIRRKIERERLTGLGPPALTLRVEDAALADRLDTLHRASEVRELLEDFNARVIAARRQLQGGPPVITPLRDVDAEVAAWAARREARTEPPTEPESQPGRRRFRISLGVRLRRRRGSRDLSA